MKKTNEEKITEFEKRANELLKQKGLSQFSARIAFDSGNTLVEEKGGNREFSHTKYFWLDGKEVEIHHSGGGGGRFGPYGYSNKQLTEPEREAMKIVREQRTSTLGH
jgi:hypothetical protein